MSFTTDATPNASIPPSEMPDATNPNPPKKDSTLKTVLIVLAVIFGIQFLLPLIFLVFIFAAVGPNIEEFFDDFTDEFSYEYDGGYSDYGGVWKIADTEQCLMLGSDNEFSWRQICDDGSDNYLSGNYTVKSGKEAVDDINLTTAKRVLTINITSEKPVIVIGHPVVFIIQTSANVTEVVTVKIIDRTTNAEVSSNHTFVENGKGTYTVLGLAATISSGVISIWITAVFSIS